MIDKLGAGHYETLDGFPAVILCLDAPGNRPVVGYVLLSHGSSVAHSWRKDGTCGNHKAEASEMDLRPVKRKPREVYIERIVFERLRGDYLCHVWVGEKAEDFSNPVLFREVMEDEE